MVPFNRHKPSVIVSFLSKALQDRDNSLFDLFPLEVPSSNFPIAKIYRCPGVAVAVIDNSRDEDGNMERR